MSHSIAQTEHPRHSVKSDAAVLHHMRKIMFVNLFYLDIQIKYEPEKLHNDLFKWKIIL